jgi:enoyl-CoA hydratase
MPELETILYSREDSVARIVLNRPERRNALNHQLLDDLDVALQQAEDDPEVLVVVLSGNGTSFCSGYDLGGSYYISPPAEGEWTVTNSLRTLRDIERRYLKLWNCSKPTIAQVHGYAIAGGCYLQMLCDISVVAEDAMLGHPISPGGVTSQPLWQVLLGPKKARYLLFSGRLIDGREAERIGLASLAVPPDELAPTVSELATGMATGRGRAGGLTHLKESLNTDLEMMGVGAMFRYHGQMNALGRLNRPAGQSLLDPDTRH